VGGVVEHRRCALEQEVVDRTRPAPLSTRVRTRVAIKGQPTVARPTPSPCDQYRGQRRADDDDHGGIETLQEPPCAGPVPRVANRQQKRRTREPPALER